MRKHNSGMDWDDFRFVLAVSRGETVSAAAKKLGVDHATVIRRINRLEQNLAAKLFERRKTGYVLTSAGHHVTETAERIESSIIADQSAIGGSKSTLSGMVRIGAPDGFGSDFLAPRLVEIAEQHPELDIQLVATARLFSLSKRYRHQPVDAQGRPDRRPKTDGLYAGTVFDSRLSRSISGDQEAQ